MRPATVLFADVKGYTAMSETRDADVVHEVMERVFRVTDRHIVAHGGRVDKHMGDAVMATFGIPKAREDDPARAIRAALAFQAELSRLAGELARDGFPHLSMRVGINTGRVMVGALADSGGTEASVVGDVVNVAARLEQACSPGGVLISRETYRQVHGLFEVQARPPIDLKGKSQALLTYQVLGMSDISAVPETREVLGRRIEMVGREDEMASVWQAFREAAEGSLPRVVSIEGAPGIGKSRLLQELERRIEREARPCTVLRAHGKPGTGAMPYEILAQMLRSAARSSASQPVEERRQRLLELTAEWLSDEGAGAGARRALGEEAAHLLGELVLSIPFPGSVHLERIRGDAKAMRARAAIALSRLLGASSRHEPLLLAIEDVHWADAASLDLLREAIRQLERGRILVAGTARPEVGATQPHWGRWASPNIHLGPLDPAEAETLVESLLQGIESVPQELIRRISIRSEGTPYFAEELVRSLADAGLLREADGRRFLAGEVGPGAIDARIPSTLEGLLQARLDQLSSQELAVVRVAAVLGRTFRRDAIAGISGLSGEELDSNLASLASREIISRVPDPSLGSGAHQFAHAMLRDAAYQTMVGQERRELHARCACWLAEEGNTGAGQMALLGHHHELARQSADAMRCYLAGARQAVALHALDEAERLYQSYLGLTPTPTEESIAVMNELGARVLQLRGRMTEAEAIHRQAGEAARRLGSAEAEGYALRCLGTVALRTGRPRDAGELYETALARFRETRTRRGEAEALEGLASTRRAEGQIGAAEALHQESLAIAREMRDRELQGTILGNFASLFAEVGRTAEAREYYESALRLQRETADLEGEHLTLGNLASVLHMLGRDDEAIAMFEQALALHRETGSTLREAQVLGNLAALHLVHGRLHEAEDLGTKAIALARAAGDRDTEARFLMNLAVILEERRRLTEACDVAATVLGIAREIGNRRLEGMALSNLGSMLQEEGRMEEALGLLREALEIDREVGNRHFEGHVLGRMAFHELLVTGDTAAAARAVASSLVLFEAVDDGPALLEHLCMRGHIELASGRAAPETLSRVRGLVAVTSDPSESLARKVAALDRACAATEAGVPLVAGMCPEDLPAAQRRWILEHRPDAVPAEVAARLEADGTLRPESRSAQGPGDGCR